jgi:hypothetical protein
MFEALGIIPSTAKTNKLGTILVPSLQELPTNFKIRTEQKPRANKKGEKKKDSQCQKSSYQLTNKIAIALMKIVSPRIKAT